MNKYWIKTSLFVLLLSSAVHAEGLIDPTKPSNFTNAAPNNSFVLSAIMISTDNRLAVINGKIHHVGDQFDGAKIISIDKNVVSIDSPNGNFILMLRDKSQTPKVRISK